MTRNFRTDPQGKETLITCSENSARHKNALITLSYFGDGTNGRYNPTNADDEPLMTMQCYYLNFEGTEWKPCYKACWLTWVPATSTEAELDRALQYLMQRLYWAISQNDCHQLSMELSWIEPSWYLPHLQLAEDERKAELAYAAEAAEAAEAAAAERPVRITNTDNAGVITQYVLRDGVLVPDPATSDYDVEVDVTVE